MAVEDLENQQDLIDSNNTGVDPILEPEKAVYTKIPEINYEGIGKAEKARRQEALNIFQQSGPQVQGEFKDWDPELDRGAMPGMDQNELRAENQTAGDLWKAGAFRFVNELTLGTLEATALMADVGMHADALMGEEQEFSNNISSKIKEYKESLNEKYGKVYTSKEDEGFSPMSGSFWANNAGNVATAITLMVPSTMAVKGLGALAKGSKLLKAMRLGNKGKGIAKGIASATISRFTENAMEASEAVTSVKHSLTNPDGTFINNPTTGVPYTQEEVNAIAGQAGVNTWRYNWAMIVPDIIQYSKMFKGIDFARRTAQNVGGKALLKSVSNFAINDMGSEALEEGYQFIASQEAQYRAKSKSGLDDGSTFYERLGKYLKDDELKTSMFMGAVGGGLFSGAGAINNYREAKAKVKERELLEDLHKRTGALVTGNPEAFNQADDMAIISKAIEYSAAGNLDMLEADLNDLYYESDESLTAQGLDPDDYRAKVKDAQKLVKETAKTINGVTNSNLPQELHSTVIASRMERTAAENSKARLSKVENEIADKDMEIFKAEEEKTAAQMSQLKKLRRQKNNPKAKELEKQILEQSDKYKTVEDINNTLATSNDADYKLLDMMTEAYDSNIAKAKEVEELIKTEEGREKLAAVVEAENKKAEARREKEAEKKKKKERAEAAKENLTPEQKAYQGKVDKATEEFGEFETTEPDGDNVFTTSLKKHGGRTWVKGEVVRDSKGNMYRVGNPLKRGNYTYGITAYTLDKDGNQIGKKVTKFENENLLKLMPESKKPGKEEWTVNKFVFQKTKKLEAQKSKEIAKENDQVAGIVRGVNSEFTNFGKPGDKDDARFFPEKEDPKYRKQGEGQFEERFKINYDLAASPMDPETPQEVTLEVDDSQGFLAVLIKQNGEIISKVEKKGKEAQFDALVEFIGSKGGSIRATIKDKWVNYAGNLANMKGAKQSVNIMKDSEFLPDGRIFIGSVKHGDSTMKFYPADGMKSDEDFKELPWSAIAAEERRAKGLRPGEGNTYMLLKAPNGTEVAVMLKESTLSEIEVAPGVTLADKVMEELNNVAAVKMTELFNNVIQEYVKDGYVEHAAIEKVMNSEEFREVLKNVSDELLADKITQQWSKKDKKGQVDKGMFYLGLSYRPTVTEVNGEKVYSLGEVRPVLSKAKPGKYETVKEKYFREDITDLNRIKEELGNRFVRTSVDAMIAEGGGKYIQNAINQKWFTTDLYHKRPWVNPRVVVQLDSEATAATKGEAKKREVRNTRTKSKSSSGKAKADTDNAMSKEAVSSARKDIKNILEFIPNEADRVKLIESGQALTAEEYVKKHLDGLISVEDFMSEVEAEIPNHEDKGMKNAVRASAVPLVSELIEDAFESGKWDNTTEEDGEVSGESTDENPNSPDNILRRMGLAEDAISGMAPKTKDSMAKAQLKREAEEAKKNKSTKEVVANKSKTGKSKSRKKKFTEADIDKVAISNYFENTTIEEVRQLQEVEEGNLGNDAYEIYDTINWNDNNDVTDKLIEIASLFAGKSVLREFSDKGKIIINDSASNKKKALKITFDSARARNLGGDTMFSQERIWKYIALVTKQINPEILSHIENSRTEQPSKTSEIKKKKPTFGKPKVHKKTRQAKNPAPVSESGTTPDVDPNIFGEAKDLLNDVQTAGDNLSPEAKKKIQKDAEIKCKK